MTTMTIVMVKKEHDGMQQPPWLISRWLDEGSQLAKMKKSIPDMSLP